MPQLKRMKLANCIERAEKSRPGAMETPCANARVLATRLMASLLFGVSAIDPFTFAVVPLVLGIVASAACLIPALYAVRISRAEAVRF